MPQVKRRTKKGDETKMKIAALENEVVHWRQKCEGMEARVLQAEGRVEEIEKISTGLITALKSKVATMHRVLEDQRAYITKRNRKIEVLKDLVAPQPGASDLPPYVLQDPLPRRARHLRVRREHVHEEAMSTSHFGKPCPLHNRERCTFCRCPKCKRGVMLEDKLGWWCSRRYARRARCTFDIADGESVEMALARAS